MMSKISGQVQEAESGRGVPGVIVRAFDKDRFFDDLLGEVMTDAEGGFQLIDDEIDAFEDFSHEYVEEKRSTTAKSSSLWTTTGNDCSDIYQYCVKNW